MLKRRDYETRIIGSPSAVPISQIVWYILAKKKKNHKYTLLLEWDTFIFSRPQWQHSIYPLKSNHIAVLNIYMKTLLFICLFTREKKNIIT